MMDIPTVAMFTGVLQGLIFWLFVLALVLGLAVLPRYFRSRDRQKTIELMRIALEKGQPLPPELITSLTTPDPEPRRLSNAGASGDLRRAVVLIAVGLGLAGLGAGLGYGIGFASPEGGAVVGGIVAGVGAIPGFIGLAFLVLWLAGRGSRTAS
jgi:hypothetical protein